MHRLRPHRRLLKITHNNDLEQTRRFASEVSGRGEGRVRFGWRELAGRAAQIKLVRAPCPRSLGLSLHDRPAKEDVYDESCGRGGSRVSPGMR